jgi:hypothetical protein
MAERKVCPFFTIEAGGKAEFCARDRCALWVPAAGREPGKGACSFLVMAARLSGIDSRLSTIAEKPK